MSEVFQKIAELLILGDAAELKSLIEKALGQGHSPREILDQGLIAGMSQVGERMKTGEMFIPEVLLSARTMQAAMEVLKPLLSPQEASGVGTYLIGTVEGDVHDIGKNLVAMMLSGAGFKVIDLGVDVKPQAFVAAVREHKPQIVGMSALLTTTIPKMKETIEALEEAGLRDKVKVMAGGAPVTQNLVDDFGADAYGASAWSAVEKAKALIGR